MKIGSKTKFRSPYALLSLLALLCGGLSGCSNGSQNASSVSENAASPSGGKKATLTLAAYTVAQEAYQKTIIPAFQAYWKKKTGEDVDFTQTYEASGTQARNIANGLEADVAALSLEGDINRIEKAGLITHDWKKGPRKGMVTYSVVAIATRKGNPKGIKDWADLAKPGVQVLTPNPKTSGGAKWNVLAMYGAGLGPAKNAPAAFDLLKGVRKNIAVMDKSGRESFSTFEHGMGDAAVTYENEALRALADRPDYELILPPATVLIENPVAVVDKYADGHGVRKVAEAFVEFLYSDEAQRAFAKNHFRPVKPEIAREFASQYPQPKRLFTVADLGGWSKVDSTIFNNGGVWDRAESH
jgi:sulfate transport system substrate-binding protein